MGTFDVSLDFSPTFGRFRGPIASGEQLESVTGAALVARAPLAHANHLSRRGLRGERAGVRRGGGAGGGAPGRRGDGDGRLPSQFVAGAAFAPLPNWVGVVGEYTFSSYAVDEALANSGTLQRPAGQVPLANSPLGWDDQHTVRVAAEAGPAQAGRFTQGMHSLRR